MKTSKMVITMILVMASFSAYAIPIDTTTNTSLDVMVSPSQPMMQHFVPTAITPIERGTTLLMGEMSMVVVKCEQSETGLPCDTGEGATTVPEPGTLWLLGSGLLLLALRRRMRPLGTA